jgi:phosphatidylserine/phosphatidylglycerophosphate/cardiolipin synthase-like enzyme
MKRLRYRLVVIALILIGLVWSVPGCDRIGSNRPLPPIAVYFSPRGGCTEAVVDEIDRATTSIQVQAYSFTSAPIAKALVEAHQRGVHVEAILDESQETEKYSSADFLVHAGILTLVDSRHAIAHNKVMIIDAGTVITGSFNFTKAAEESNAENLLVIRDSAIAEEYAANWQQHALHSTPYERKQPAQGGARSAATKKSKAGTRKAND